MGPSCFRWASSTAASTLPPARPPVWPWGRSRGAPEPWRCRARRAVLIRRPNTSRGGPWKADQTHRQPDRRGRRPEKNPPGLAPPRRARLPGGAEPDRSPGRCDPAAARPPGQGGFDRIVAAGGDGTLNEAINGLAPSSLPLGFLPLGTTNVFALEAGIPFAVEKACDIALDGAPTPVCLGAADGARFLLMAGVGFDAEVVYRVSARLKRWSGKLAYLASAVSLCFARLPPRSKSSARTAPFFGAYSLIIGNGRLYGGRFSVTPEASLTEDLLDVCLFRKWGRNPSSSLCGQDCRRRQARRAAGAPFQGPDPHRHRLRDSRSDRRRLPRPPAHDLSRPSRRTPPRPSRTGLGPPLGLLLLAQSLPSAIIKFETCGSSRNAATNATESAAKYLWHLPYEGIKWILKRSWFFVAS